MLTTGFAQIAVPPATAQDAYAARENWSDYYESDLNISVFVFRDTNRDGLYDMGDHPMSGIIVEGMGLGRPISAVSNSAGFANFEMSGTQSDADIMFEGQYRFEVIVPRRWSVTTDNVSQSVEFKLTPGSPADMVAQPPPALVGLAPDLFIFGTLGGDASSIGLTGPDGDLVEVEADATGHFSVEAQPGEWDFEAPVSKRLDVSKTPVLLADTWWDETGVDPTAMQSVGFDDLQSEGVLKIPSGYAGLGWENFVMTHRKFYEPEGYRNGTMSGEFLAYNGSGHPAAIKRDQPFDFVGGYFGISTLEAEGETLIITGWRDETQVYRQEMTLSALGPVYLAADFNDITRLDFETEHYWQFTADDLDFALGQ